MGELLGYFCSRESGYSSFVEELETKERDLHVEKEFEWDIN